MPLVFLLVAALTAVVDWWAVRTGRSDVEAIAKPLTMVWLIAAAIGIDAEPSSVKPWFVLGLAFGLIGDVLLLPRNDRFVPGLVSFLLGHLAYIVGLAAVGVEDRALVIGLGAAALAAAVLGMPVITAVKDTKLALPVNIYAAAIASMAGMAYATQRPLLWIGAALFVASDVLLARQRFVADRPDQRVYVHILYHLGQGLLVIGMAAA